MAQLWFIPSNTSPFPLNQPYSTLNAAVFQSKFIHLDTDFIASFIHIQLHPAYTHNAFPFESQLHSRSMVFNEPAAKQTWKKYQTARLCVCVCVTQRSQLRSRYPYHSLDVLQWAWTNSIYSICWPMSISRIARRIKTRTSTAKRMRFLCHTSSGDKQISLQC